MSIGFKQSLNDPALYWRAGDDGTSFILVYVDDFLVFISKSSPHIPKIKGALTEEFKMKDLGEVKSFLGIEITRNHLEYTITLSQKGYIKGVIERFGLIDAKPCWMPMVNTRPKGLTKKEDSKEFNPRKELYWSIVGSLMYLIIATRPDLASLVGIVSRYLSNPTEEHLTAVKRILRYIKRTKEYVLTLGRTYSKIEPSDIYGYADADWANDANTRKSTTGYVFYTGRGVISWCSKRQPTIALSTTEAKYIALCTAV